MPIKQDEVEVTLVATLDGDGETPIMAVEVGGKRIAKRYSKGDWIPLEPGWSVHGGVKGSYGRMAVEYRPTEVIPH
jgi:hypothetical protein